MKYGKKCLALLLALMMGISLFPTAAFAEGEEAGVIAPVEEPEEIAGEIAPAAPEEESEDLPPADGTDAVVSGQCGDDLTWSFDEETGVLSISGTGDMWNWDSMESPWYAYCEEIAWIFLPEDGPTSIGDRAFEMCSSLQYVQIPTCVRSIGDYAFAYCTSLKMIDFIGSAPGIGEHAFAGVTAMAYYPANDDTWTEEVRQDYGGDIAWPVASPDQCGDNLYWSLDEETGVLTITGSGDMWDWYRWSLTPWAWVGIDITAVELPDGLTSIGNFAFLFEGSLKAIEIPASVTRIGHYACYGCRSLTRVEIPAGVTSIGHAAFGSGGITEIIVAEENEDYRSVDGILYSKDMTTLIQCPGGKTGEVVIPDTITSIGSHEKVEGISFGDGPAIYAGAFTGCTSLTSVTIPEGVTSIGEWTFGSCSSLKNVTLPETLTSIGDGAFYSCHSLASITIPAGVTSLGGSLFIDSGNSLHTIWFEGSAPNIAESAFYGVTANAYYPANDDTWTEEVRQDYGGDITWVAYDPTDVPSGQCGDDLYWSFDPSTGTLTITGTGDMWNGNYSPWHLYSREITSVSLPEGLTSIGDWAFYYCDSLTSVAIPEGVTTIGCYSFYCTALTEVTIPAGVIAIGSCAFTSCAELQRVSFPDSLHFIGDRAFKSCAALTEVTIPAGVTEIPEECFSSCSALTDVHLQDGVSAIGRNAFSSCRNLTTLELSADLESIGDWAFFSCDSLTSVAIPASVTSIGESAFSECSSLTSVTIPESVTSIGGYAFGSCSSLKEIRFKGSAPSIGNYAFIFVTATAYYPANDDTWTEEVRQDYGGDITWVGCVASGQCGDELYWILGENDALIIIGTGDMWDFDSYLFPSPWDAYTADIRSLELPEGLTSIGYGAFSSCTAVTEVRIPSTVTRIGDAAFNYCISLSTVELQEGLIELGRGAFAKCNSLTSISIPASVTTIGKWTFSECVSMTAITVAESNAEYSSADGILYNKDQSLLICCPSGRDRAVTIPETVTTVGADAFSCCLVLPDVTIPGSVRSIESHAFDGCTSLTSVTIPEGVITIGDWAFNLCWRLERVTISGTVTSIGEYGFANCTPLNTIVFAGSAPEIGQNAFQSAVATVYYPANDDTWTEEVRQQYNGTLTWKEYDARFNPFQDVKLGKYYYDPVLWAYYHEPQITSGTGEASFSPNQTCTRGQIVTFLWNAAGAPEPAATENPFVDVTEDKYYYKAVLWAVENGITGGMDATHFGPKEICTREQVVTFLWSAAGKPEPTATSKPFADVKEGKYYCKAVLWALENGVTSGMSETSFGVGVPCTRGQVVTFLYAAKDLLMP